MFCLVRALMKSEAKYYCFILNCSNYCSEADDDIFLDLFNSRFDFCLFLFWILLNFKCREMCDIEGCECHEIVKRVCSSLNKVLDLA